ncbi:DUF6894 family protein [Methylobacterium brachythecii]|uniref:DUF6894 domain-containing protein n=2 Tax=Methylobacterium brachythecii TaxID=1176177 RepID=A0ABQ6DAF5_9HYPH|nr:hypothetical protein GCM10007884_32670 [Methylobacterium brachythecii]
MPRYFFDAHDGREMVDHDGCDCPNDRAAIRHAAVIASDFMKDPTTRPEDGGAVVVTVRDHGRQAKAEVRLAFNVQWSEVADRIA